MAEDLRQKLLTDAAEAIDDMENWFPDGQIDAFVIVLSVGAENESKVGIVASDPRDWSQKGLLEAGIERIEDEEEDDD